MRHHSNGGHAHGPHEDSRRSHLPLGLKQAGVLAVLGICVAPVIDGLLTGNVVGVILWCMIADLLCKFVWSWS